MGTKQDVSCISFKNGKVKTERTEAGKQKWEGRQNGMVVAWLISQKAKLGNTVTSRENQKKGLYTAFKVMKEGLSWWSRGWESACWCRGHSFDPWSRKMSHAKGQLSLCATTTEPMCHNCWNPCTLEPMLHNKRSHHDAHVPQEKSPHLTATRKNPHAAKTHHILIIIIIISSAAQSCPTFCDPMDCSMPGFPVSISPRVCPSSCPLSRWCHSTISSSVIPFSSHPQSFPATGSFEMSQFFVSGGQSIGVSASTSVLPVNIQDRFPLAWTGWISLQFKGLSGVFSNATVQPQPLINNFKIKFWRN